METMTVSEVIDKLSKYPSDMPVFATWEGVIADVMASSFDVVYVTKDGLQKESLVIDVEEY